MSFEINPLNVLGQRITKSMPVHFSKTNIGIIDYMKSDTVVNWINTRLKGRYCVSTEPEVDSKGQLRVATFVGFENHKELTYFILACPYLRRN
jgi:hypothetical protein